MREIERERRESECQTNLTLYKTVNSYMPPHQTRVLKKTASIRRAVLSEI